jgi:hypothetical protein
VYFVAYNEKSEDKTYSVTLKEGETLKGNATLQRWSQRTNVASLGALAKGTHSYSLYVGEEKVCDASVTVNDVTGACSIGGNPYVGQQISVNVTGVNANTQFTWTLTKDAQTIGSRTIDCGSGGCWNNTMNAPTTTGTYSYTVTKGTNTICTGSVNIGSILSCSVDPAELNRKAYYTFSATRNLNCWNCSFTYDSGTQSNISFPDGSNTVELTKMAMVAGEKTLTFACTCENNYGTSCSENITINDADEPFTCPTDNNPYEWECKSGNTSGGYNNWGTGARCVKIKASKVTVQSSNAQGRAFCVNGNEAEMNGNEIMTKEYSAADDGYITVCATAGDLSYTYIGWYNCVLSNTGESSSSVAESSSSEGTTSSASPTSSGSVTEMVITNGQYPPQVNNVASGTCFSLSGIWNNDCNRHPQLNCNVTSGNAGIRITYGSNHWETQNYNIKQDLGVAMPCSPDPAVFIDRVCVEWTNGTTGWCKFEN